MNNIGFGIFCFGEDYYYQGTFDKIRNILNEGYHCYILTDTPDKFTTKYSSSFKFDFIFSEEREIIIKKVFEDLGETYDAFYS